jgi:RNA polymerase sigma-70 factor (ECF subfamily)
VDSKLESFENSMMPHVDSVYRAAVAMSGSYNDAEDLTQATMLKALEKFETFKKGTNANAWLMSILRNKWIDKLRKRGRAVKVISIDETRIAKQPEGNELIDSNSEDIISNFSDEQVIKALKSLPPEQRFALFLVDVEQLSHQEVAEIMQIAVGTVKSRTSRGRAALKSELSSYARQMGFTGDRR